MELIPTQEEVIELLRTTGGLRDGHFEYPTGLHGSEYLQVALTMRDFQAAKMLSVALSRKLRAHSDIRALIPNVSVVAPATGGLPVAYGVGEALRARKVYWGETNDGNGTMVFRQYLELDPGEKVILVDDIMRTGRKILELKRLVENAGGEVVAIAVMVYQPDPFCARFDPLPFYYLARLDAGYVDAANCDQCKRGEPLARVLV
jgi:orotate phosphoribosyltransferase